MSWILSHKTLLLWVAIIGFLVGRFFWLMIRLSHHVKITNHWRKKADEIDREFLFALHCGDIEEITRLHNQAKEIRGRLEFEKRRVFGK